MNPQTRTLKQVTVDDAALADELIELLMGDEVGPQRSFLEEYGQYAQLDV
jgi:DNA gyrase subunit B